MTDKSEQPRELRLDLTLDVPRDRVWRCWTEMALLDQWFCPRPWTAKFHSLDLRPGGASHCVMRGPNGEEVDNRGVYLEVDPERRLVFTDAYVTAWEPSAEPFFTGIVELADAGPGRTKYTAIARHWTAEACKQHADMGFHEGWTAAARQLEELAAALEEEGA